MFTFFDECESVYPEDVPIKTADDLINRLNALSENYDENAEQIEQLWEDYSHLLDGVLDQVEAPTILKDYDVRPEHLTRLESMGFGGRRLQVLETTNSKSEKSIEYLVDGDIHLTKNDLYPQCRNCHYRINTIVSVPSGGRTINILAFDLTDPTIRAAFELALENYNSLNLSLTFTSTYLTENERYGWIAYHNGDYTQIGNYLNALAKFIQSDIQLYQPLHFTGQAALTGTAYFPSGGNPGNPIYIPIQIVANVNNYSDRVPSSSANALDVLEGIITHEIGHTIGLRHSDWFNRDFSCGTDPDDPNQMDDISFHGAIHIPGTPTNSFSGRDANSVMKACWDYLQTGEFTNYDRIALETIYPVSSSSSGGSSGGSVGPGGGPSNGGFPTPQNQPADTTIIPDNEG